MTPSGNMFGKSERKTAEVVRIMKRRNKFDIVIAILDVVSSGANKTKIVYKANLNFNLATTYMELLLERGLVRTDGSIYEITAKGEIFAKKAKELQI